MTVIWGNPGTRQRSIHYHTPQAGREQRSPRRNWCLVWCLDGGPAGLRPVKSPGTTRGERRDLNPRPPGPQPLPCSSDRAFARAFPSSGVLAFLHGLVPPWYPGMRAAPMHLGTQQACGPDAKSDDQDPADRERSDSRRSSDTVRRGRSVRADGREYLQRLLVADIQQLAAPPGTAGAPGVDATCASRHLVTHASEAPDSSRGRRDRRSAKAREPARRGIRSPRRTSGGSPAAPTAGSGARRTAPNAAAAPRDR